MKNITIFMTGARSSLGQAVINILPPEVPLTLFLVDACVQAAEEAVSKLNPMWDVTFIPHKFQNAKDLPGLAPVLQKKLGAVQRHSIDLYLDLQSYAGPSMPIAQTVLGNITTTFQENVFGPFALLQGVLPLLLARVGEKPGIIVMPFYERLETDPAFKADFVAARRAYYTLVTALVAEQRDNAVRLEQVQLPQADIALMRNFFPGDPQLETDKALEECARALLFPLFSSSDNDTMADTGGKSDADFSKNVCFLT